MTPIDASDVRLDFPFTAHDSPTLRARIESDLTRIVGALAARDPHLRAVVLTGGFSRGEGTSKDDRPLNDYDLFAFRDRPGGRARYQAAAAALTQEIALEVDVMPVWTWRVPRLAPKLSWLDVRLGGRVLAGDAAALRALPRFTAADLPLRELARLLGNRAAGLLLALPGPRAPIDEAACALQATKAVLAAMDAQLLACGEYAPSLRERLALTESHSEHETFATAVGWKLGDDVTLPRRWWDIAAACLLDAVERTGARLATDDVIERAFHFVRAQRVARSPSQAVRQAAWDVVALSRFPDGPLSSPLAADILERIAVDRPGGQWSDLKASFFASRARTLQ